MRLIFLLAFCLYIVHGSTGVNAKEGIAAASLQGIYAGEQLTDFDKKTVDQLREGIRKIYGIDVPLLMPAADLVEKDKIIVVGKSSALETYRLTEKEFAGIPADGFLIWSDNEGVVIAGNSGWATLDGVYYFLEQVGMRFYLPHFNQAQIAESTSGIIPSLSITAGPDFSYRSGRSLVWHQMYHRLGDPRNGLNPELFYTKQTGSDLWIDHTAGYLVPKLMFYDSHPEYYALVDGKRIDKERFTDHRTPLCLSNRDVVKISTERALGWIEKEPEKSHFMITYGDTGVWCECSECRKLDVRRGAYTDRLLSWVNPVARAVREKHPEKVLMTFAYSETSTPPVRETPEENVWIVGATGLGNIFFWDHAWKRGQIPQKLLNELDGWLKIVPDRYTVCEYQSNAYKPALVDTLASRLRFYREKGVRGIAFTFGLPQNFRGLWGYLYSHLMWDVEQDGMQLAREYIDFYFKEGASYIKELIALSHERYRETLSRDLPSINSYPVGYYSNEFTASVAEAFAKAAEAVRNDEKLFEEIQKEETYFLYDWMRHPGYTSFDAKAEEILTAQLERLLVLIGQDTKMRVELGRTLHRLALTVEKQHKGTLRVVEDWILGRGLHVSFFEKKANGVALPSEAFRFAGFGPARYGYHCPPQDAVGVYVKGNSKHRSHRMVAEFEWDEALLEDADLLLNLTGQVSSSDIIKPKIEILINDTEIYSGSADFVSNNWSAQSYTIPAGVVRRGWNAIEIRNISNPLTVLRWNQRWCLISATEIVLRQKEGGGQ
jgi:hypothetical protein